MAIRYCRCRHASRQHTLPGLIVRRGVLRAPRGVLDRVISRQMRGTRSSASTATPAGRAERLGGAPSTCKQPPAVRRNCTTRDQTAVGSTEPSTSVRRIAPSRHRSIDRSAGESRHERSRNGVSLRSVPRPVPADQRARCRSSASSTTDVISRDSGVAERPDHTAVVGPLANKGVCVEARRRPGGPEPGFDVPWDLGPHPRNADHHRPDP